MILAVCLFVAVDELAVVSNCSNTEALTASFQLKGKSQVCVNGLFQMMMFIVNPVVLSLCTETSLIQAPHNPEQTINRFFNFFLVFNKEITTKIRFGRIFSKERFI